MKLIDAIATLTAALAIAGCATQAPYDAAFDPAQANPAASQVLAASPAAVWPAALAVLARQGFTATATDPAAGVISVRRLMADPDHADESYTIDATVTIAPAGRGGKTMVALAANQQTIEHQKRHDWWHLLWIVPLFPIGTEYNTVVRAESTVTDAGFYSAFFDAMKTALKPPAVAGADR